MERLKKLKNYIQTFILAVSHDSVGIYAAYASFFIIISAIPFAMLLLSLVKFFVPDYVNTALMMNGVRALAPHSIYNFLHTIVAELMNRSSTASIVSVTAITTLWSASKGFWGLYQGLNNVHKPEKMPNYFYARILSIFYTVIFIFILLLTIIVFAFGDAVQGLLNTHLPSVAAIVREFMNAKIIIFGIVLTFTFAAMYKILPRKKITLRSQLPGAACAAAGWMLFTYFYSIYIENFSNYSYIYGSLTAVVLLMLWLFFCMNIFLYGAELNVLKENKFNKI